LVAFLSVLGYGIARVSYERFYDQFGLVPGDVGASNSTDPLLTLAPRLETSLNDAVPEDPLQPGVYVEETSLRARPVDGVETTKAADAPLSYPGVYVEETSPGPKPIPGVATSGVPCRRGRLGFLSALSVLKLRRRRRPDR
jgi:hypothetical protein